MSGRFETLELEAAGGIARVWLNRPVQRNAMSETMTAELSALFRALAKDSTVRVVVLGGRGSAFCAGADLGKMRAAGKASRASNRAHALRSAKFMHQLWLFDKPLVARIHGPAFAGAMGMVCTSDVVVAGEEAVFCLPETKIGLVPAMISPYVTRAMGLQAARRYLLSAERFSAAQAKAMGLVQELVPMAELDAAVERVAQAFLACAPGALAEAKKLLRKVAGAPITPALIAHTAGVIAKARAGDEAQEGIAAFREKRKPRWA